MFRQKRSRKRHSSPYPHLGTPAGDQSIGPCQGEGCDRQLRRGDIFFCLADGRTLCIDCYEKIPGISLARAIPAEAPQAVKQPASVWDGEFPT